LKSFFSVLITKKFKLRNKEYLTVKGLKLIISGRLRDKQRSSFICLQEGKIPITNLKSGVDFSKMPAHTIYGVFGIKIWAFR
jgi:small subunit ribosomal protein S3